MNAVKFSPAALTRVRYGVLGFVCALSMITYLDRVCFGSAVSHIVGDLSLQSEADLKLAFTAFAFAYAAFEVPSGWLGDVFGPRKTLIRIVLWWSFFTALTGMVGMPIAGTVFGGLGLLVAVRFLFGVGEAGAYPNITRALHNWFPLTERAFGQGAVWMAGRFMGGMTPLVWALLIEYVGFSWRSAFWFFGVLGVLWCVSFAVWFRNRPEEKPEVGPAELDLIRAGRADREAAHAGVPWGKFLTSVNLWALCLMYFCGAYGWYFNITYLPKFLEGQYDVQVKDLVGALYKGGPLWMGAVACLVGGLLSDRFIGRTGNRKWGRRRFGLFGHGLCGLCYLGCLWVPKQKEYAFLFFLSISLAAFFNDLTMGPAWATCQDIGKRYAAIVAGCMNTIGNLGGAVAGWVTGAILDHTLAAHAVSIGVPVEKMDAAQKAAGLLPGYQINFISFAAVYGVAVLLWLRIDATEPVVPEEA
jgi:MFS family permease